MPHRTPRHFQVYKGERLVLSLEDTPGLLISQASPPPGGAPKHPFANARAFDAMTEGDLGEMLWASSSFDDFLRRLIAAGFNISSWNESSYEARQQGQRLHREDRLVGVLWPGKGQFTTLLNQPPYDTLIFEHGALTAYEEAEADIMLKILEETTTFSGLKESLRQAGYEPVKVEPYSP
ncbi:MAG: hypothetical protein IAE89_00270 [Anaerolineae bacterium]|nr:hypothetical protein [Anaerolineae bacterium]